MAPGTEWGSDAPGMGIRDQGRSVARQAGNQAMMSTASHSEVHPIDPQATTLL